MIVMSLMPSFDQLHERNYGKPPSPEARARDVPVWNALLDQAIEPVAQAKDEFVLASEWESAAVARDLADALRAMKTERGSAELNSGGTAPR